MSEATVHNLLDIYRTRLRMAEKGTIRPGPGVVEGMGRLVSGLSLLAPETKIALEIQPFRTLFKLAATGELVAQIDFPGPAEPGASPNGGPAEPLGNSGAGGGPPSVS
jgi:hypothetical protein